jgi:hypothetical protein
MAYDSTLQPSLENEIITPVILKTAEPAKQRFDIDATADAGNGSIELLIHATYIIFF